MNGLKVQHNFFPKKEIALEEDHRQQTTVHSKLSIALLISKSWRRRT